MSKSSYSSSCLSSASVQVGQNTNTNSYAEGLRLMYDEFRRSTGATSTLEKNGVANTANQMDSELHRSSSSSSSSDDTHIEIATAEMMKAELRRFEEKERGKREEFAHFENSTKALNTPSKKPKIHQ